MYRFMWLSNKILFICSSCTLILITKKKDLWMLDHIKYGQISSICMLWLVNQRSVSDYTLLFLNLQLCNSIGMTPANYMTIKTCIIKVGQRLRDRVYYGSLLHESIFRTVSFFSFPQRKIFFYIFDCCVVGLLTASSRYTSKDPLPQWAG